MSNDDQHRAVEIARVRAGLSVQQLWLRYLALGGSNDAFDVDGYLQGLVSMETFQRDVLAHAVNEALDELVDSLRVPLSGAGEPATEDSVRDVIRQLIAGQPEGLRTDGPPPGGSGQSPGLGS